MSRFQHPSYAGQIGPAPSPLPRLAPINESIPHAGLTALARADRACCCPAQPAVIVVVPTATGARHEADLLLCMHHYRASRQKLAACGARVFDGAGIPLTDRDLWI